MFKTSSSNVNDELIFRRTYPESTLSSTVVMPATTKSNAPILARVDLQQSARRRSRCTTFVQVVRIRWTLIPTEHLNTFDLDTDSQSNKCAIAKGTIQPKRQNFAANMSGQARQTSSSFLIDISEIVRVRPKKRWGCLGTRSSEAIRRLPEHLCLIIELDTKEEEYDNEDLVLVGVAKNRRHGAFYNLTVDSPLNTSSGRYRFSSPEIESLPAYLLASEDEPPLYKILD